MIQKMGSKDEEGRKAKDPENDQLQVDDILDEIIPLEHSEKRANKQVTDKHLTWHDGSIPTEKVYLKLGVDNGQGSKRKKKRFKLPMFLNQIRLPKQNCICPVGR